MKAGGGTSSRLGSWKVSASFAGLSLATLLLGAYLTIQSQLREGWIHGLPRLPVVRDTTGSPAGPLADAVRGAWNVAIVLEPFCPTQPDYELEKLCSAKGAGALSEGKCWKANLGISNTWRYQTSYTVALPIHAECWRGKPHYKASYTAVFRRIQQGMRNLGWEQYSALNFGNVKVTAEVHGADVLILTTKHYRFISSRLPCPKFILIAVDDPATLEREIDYNDPRILAVLQHTAIIPRSENNMLPMQQSRKEYKGSGHPQIPRHFEWMSRDPLPLTRRCPQIRAEALEKVVPMIPQGIRMRFPLDCGGGEGNLGLQGAFWKDLSWSPPLAKRKVDIMYLGSSHNSSGMILREHRAAAVRQLQRIQENHPHLSILTGLPKVSPSQFYTMLRSAKIFISPFGLGEFSGKDYESALAGCLLVKPLASKLESYPNIYKSSVALEVKVDFSDLEEVVMRALDDLPRSQAMVDEQRTQLREHNPQKLAMDLDALLMERLPDVSERVSMESCRAQNHLVPAMISGGGHKCAKGSAKEGRAYRRIQRRIRNNCYATRDNDDA